MAKAIMFLGTGSDVGKSIAATAFCRIFKRRGYKVAPFKAQNMSNNSYVTVEGGEIGRAQVVQAEAADVLPSVHMNPILLKPSSSLGSQIILHGKVFGQMEALAYHNFKPRLKNAVFESFERLAGEYEFIVMEGAGSCCEINLKENDLVNFSMAKAVHAPCIIVADIDRGGVFAQIIGTFHLMTRKERELTVGFLINKFRGDRNLFSSGIEYIEKKTGRPVLGLIPFYRDILIDSEDSVAVQEDKRRLRPVDTASVNIAVVRLPSISNFTDLEILEREPDVVVNYLFRTLEFSKEYDCLILPGAKNVMEDAAWLARTGWKKVIGRFVKEGGQIFGICGGYQLLGEKIKDPLGVESDRREIEGLNLLPIETLLEDQKVVRRVTGICLMNGKRVSGYEIHMGRSKALLRKGEPFLRIHQTGDKKSWDDGWSTAGGRIAGTYVHGILDSQGFRGEFLNSLRRSRGLEEKAAIQGRLGRFHQYDLLADHFEAHCDVEKILSLMAPRQEDECDGKSVKVILMKDIDAHIEPEAIEKSSFEIIEFEVPEPRPFEGDEWLVARRMIHTTADFELLSIINFHPDAIKSGIVALKSGCLIVTDTEMARKGITLRRMDQLGCRVECYIGELEVKEKAQKKKITRAAAAVDHALSRLNRAIYVVGNAPTALLRLLECIKEGKCNPAVIVGMPVGFVNAAESKEALMGQTDIPFITIEGRKGGTTLAVSVVNQLAEMALEGFKR